MTPYKLEPYLTQTDHRTSAMWMHSMQTLWTRNLWTLTAR